MDILTRKELEFLLAQEGEGPYVSIYMPTHSTGEEIKQGPIRLKNLTAKVEEQLIAKGIRPQERTRLLELPRKLISESMFWSNQGEGLAIFISPDVSRYLRLPHSFHELAVVMDSFHTKPLLPLLAEDGQFYVLAISQQDARFLQCTRDIVEEIDLGQEIAEFEKEIKEQFPETNLQFHTGAPRQANGRAATFFSQGGEVDNTMRAKVMRYFRLIDTKIREILQEDRAPVVLAAVEYLMPLYREAGKYANILDEGIKGNPEHLSAKELHQKSWEIVRPYFQSRQNKARSLYREQKGTGMALTSLEEIVPASFHGRVETLFVSLGVQQWGTFDPQNNSVHVTGEPASGAKDLLDLAAVQAFLKNGAVYAVDPADMPDAEPLAALLRY